MDFLTLTLKYWVEALFGLTLAGFGILFKTMYKKIKDTQSELVASKYGIRGILRDRIIQMYNYHSNKGYCPIYELENALSMYKEYKALGGNGTIEGLIQDLQKLPKHSPAEGEENTIKK